MKRYSNRLAAPFLVAAMLFLGSMLSANAQDLAEIRERGVLRHLGIPYARFVTGNGDGLDVEIIQLFAQHIGVRYEFVSSEWNRLFPDLLGQTTPAEQAQAEHPTEHSAETGTEATSDAGDGENVEA